MTKSWRLLGVGLSLTVLGACDLTDGSEESADCDSPLIFSGSTYVFVGGEEDTVTPGRLLGTGQHTPCNDGGGTTDDSRDVYALPGVPLEQALVVLGDRGRGLVHLSTTRPSGWDSDLLALLQSWSVRPPSGRNGHAVRGG